MIHRRATTVRAHARRTTAGRITVRQHNRSTTSEHGFSIFLAYPASAYLEGGLLAQANSMMPVFYRTREKAVAAKDRLRPFRRSHATVVPVERRGRQVYLTSVQIDRLETPNRAGKGDAWGADAAKKAASNAAKAAKAKDAATRKKFLKRTQEDVDAGIDAIDTRPDIARTDMS